MGKEMLEIAALQVGAPQTREEIFSHMDNIFFIAKFVKSKAKIV